MNVGGGEAADQMVRMMLSGTEVMVRLSGSALKNMLALTMALASNRKVLSGKVNMGKMLRETRDLRRFPMTPEQYKQFQKLAKKHKLLFSVIKDKDDKGKVLDVILPVTELDRANAIFERILYTLPPEPERRPAKPLQRGHEVFRERQAPEREAPEQAPVRRQEQPKDKPRERQPPERKKPVLQPQEAPVRPPQPQREVSQRSEEQGRQQAPVTQRQVKEKNGSRSERDSHVIKISSSILKESGAMRGTSERPSIEARLQGYRAQAKKQSAPAKVKAKTKNQAKAR
ncbi:PcfB family protein [Faecalibaculum rodentium]|uniref:PcfB family protein n=1 Tax=Faecalibaculum rodentium TaxID=1702221 RepID=UPI0025B01DB0|nr:PcfB family protein [Faecalibaculum rodentium]